MRICRFVICVALLMALLCFTGCAMAEESGVTVWGHTIALTDTEVTFERGDKGSVDALCEALAQLPALKNVYMWDCVTRPEERAAMHAARPDVFFGWTIQINSYHQVRTDWTAYSAHGRKPKLYKKNMTDFTYMPNLLALDVGHNSITDLEFLRDCAQLKILIVADCGLKDITPLESQTQLEYLELFLNNITDISVLAGMTELRDVNLAFNDITDLSPLYELPHLERVWLMRNDHLSDEEVERLREHQPDCEIVTRSYGATGNLLDEKGRQIPGTSWRHHRHYDTIYYIFKHNEWVSWDLEVPQIKTVNDY